MTYVTVKNLDRVEREYSVGFVLPANVGKDELHQAARWAWDKFLAVMEKRNWHYLDNQKPRIEGPRVYVAPTTLPSAHMQGKSHPSQFLTDIPSLYEADSWLYTVKGNFWVDSEKMEVLIPDVGDVPVNYSKRIQADIARQMGSS